MTKTIITKNNKPSKQNKEKTEAKVPMWTLGLLVGGVIDRDSVLAKMKKNG